MAKSKADNFIQEGKKHPCGEYSLKEMLKYRKSTYIKDLDGNILYEGRGPFQAVLEKAVKEGVALPKADLRNQTFVGLSLEGADLSGAKFDGSIFNKSISIRSTSLIGVSFANTKISNYNGYKWLNLINCNVEKADLGGHKLTDVMLTSPFNVKNRISTLKNLDKAYNVMDIDLDFWNELEGIKLREKINNIIPTKSNNVFNIAVNSGNAKIVGVISDHLKEQENKKEVKEEANKKINSIVADRIKKRKGIR